MMAGLPDFPNPLQEFSGGFITILAILSTFRETREVHSNAHLFSDKLTGQLGNSNR